MRMRAGVYDSSFSKSRYSRTCATNDFLGSWMLIECGCVPSDCQYVSTLSSRSCSAPNPGLALDSDHTALPPISLSPSECSGSQLLDGSSWPNNSPMISNLLASLLLDTANRTPRDAISKQKQGGKKDVLVSFISNRFESKIFSLFLSLSFSFGFVLVFWMSSVIEQWCNTIEILRRGERDEFLELLSSTEAPSVAMLKDCASRVLLESAGEGTLVARFEGLFGLAMEAASEAPGLSVHVLEQGLTTQAVSHWGELLEVVFRRHAGFAALCARDDVRRGLLSVFRECLRLLSPVLHSLLMSRFLLLLALLFEQPAAASAASSSAAVVTTTAPPSQRHEPSLISRTLPCRRLPSSGLATPSEGDRGRFEAFWNLQET